MTMVGIMIHCIHHFSYSIIHGGGLSKVNEFHSMTPTKELLQLMCYWIAQISKNFIGKVAFTLIHMQIYCLWLLKIVFSMSQAVSLLVTLAMRMFLLNFQTGLENM